MPASTFTYTAAQKEALERLVALGLCRPNSMAVQAQIDLVWQHVPVEQGGGMGLGLHQAAIAAYVMKKAHTVIDKRDGMARWQQWVENHNQHAPVPYVKPEPVFGCRWFSAEDRKILQNLVSLELCRVTKREKIQLQNVWLVMPVEKLGGRGLGLGIEQVLNWVRRTCITSGRFAGDEEASMAKWEKWISNHDHLVPPYQYSDGTWSRESHPSSAGASEPNQGPVGATEHGDSDSPLTDLSDLGVDPTSPIPARRVLSRAEPKSGVLVPTTRTPTQMKRKKGTNKKNTTVPSAYHFRNRETLANGKKIRYADYYSDSDSGSEHAGSSDDEITKPQPNVNVSTKSARSKRVAFVAPTPGKSRGNNATNEKEASAAPYRLRRRTPLDREASDAVGSSRRDSRNDEPTCDVPITDRAPKETDQGETTMLQLPARLSATPCPQSRVAKGTSISTTISAPELNTQQRAALDALGRHGMLGLTQRAIQQIRDVWSKVELVEGGGKGLNITPTQIQRYLTENGLNERDADEKQNALIRWEQWINSHRGRAGTARSWSRGTNRVSSPRMQKAH